MPHPKDADWDGLDLEVAKRTPPQQEYVLVGLLWHINMGATFDPYALDRRHVFGVY